MKREMVAGVSVLRRPGAGGFVLLHGVGSDAETWAGVVAGLDASVGVMAWDAPGYGESVALDVVSPTPADYAERLALVLGTDRVVLVGHSLGALFAARFAVMYPERVRALVLLSPAVGYGVAPGAALPVSVQARIDDLDALGPVAFAAKRAGRLVHRPEALAGVRRAMAAVRPDGYAQAVRALGAGRLLEDAVRIVVPALVAVGAEDVVTLPAQARAVRDALVTAGPLVVVPEAGHALPQEAPETVAALLMEARGE